MVSTYKWLHLVYATVTSCLVYIKCLAVPPFVTITTELAYISS